MKNKKQKQKQHRKGLLANFCISGHYPTLSSQTQTFGLYHVAIHMFFTLFSLLKSEEGETKSTENALELWSEKPITTEDRWYLSPGR